MTTPTLTPAALEFCDIAARGCLDPCAMAHGNVIIDCENPSTPADQTCTDCGTVACSNCLTRFGVCVECARMNAGD